MAASRGSNGAEGEFKDGGAAPGQGPAAEPAAIGVGVKPDHLIELTMGGMFAGQGFGKADAVPLVEVHGGGRRRLRGRGGKGCPAGWGVPGCVCRGRTEQILILA
jgi:hypothetical protein